jgi:histidinol-phosphatase (PHP family)
LKVDFHFHLEEGPYSFGWLRRTATALQSTLPDNDPPASLHTKAWLDQTIQHLQERLQAGCFNMDWLERYIRVGRARGIEQFGVVDHLYRFKECKEYYEQHMLLDDSPIGKLQRTWLDQVCAYSIDEYLEGMYNAAQTVPQLAVGLEADYFPGGEKQLGELLNRWQLDYVIGSVHFLDGWGFDNPDAQQRFRDYDLLELYANHFAVVNGAIASGMFDIIAHLDNLKVFDFRPDEARLLPIYREVAASMKTHDMATEINTGLLYRYPVKEMCPSPSFLQVLFEHGVPITLSSDAHFPDDIGMHLDHAAQAAQSAGYREIAYYRSRVRHTIPL